METIRFKKEFQPDRISGKKKDIEKLGMKILSKPSKDSYMWDYEYPLKIKIPKKEFEVELCWNDEHDCCDITFCDSNVAFGYVDDTDFLITKLKSKIQNINFKMKKKHKPANRKCWLCGVSKPDTIITVECETPGGKQCKPKEVKVHFGCYMDMDA